MAKIVDSYEVRQTVKSVEKTWLETLYSSVSEHQARLRFQELSAQHPTEYFELVKVIRHEECLDYTPHKKAE